MATYLNTKTEKQYVLVSYNADGTWMGKDLDDEGPWVDEILPSLTNGEWVKTSTNCACDYYGSGRTEPYLD